MGLARHVRKAVRGTLSVGRMGHAVEGYELQGAACLTYDDGPDPVGTTAVLAALAEREAKATFFVLATRVRRYPEVFADVVAAGHEIALHGYDHRDLSACSPKQVRTLCLDGLAIIEDALGSPVRWFRPPYIALRADGWLALRGTPLRLVGAGSDLADWDPQFDDAARVEHFRQHLSAGDAVLAHDAWAGPDDNALPAPEPSVDRGLLARRSLELLEDRNLRPVTLTTAAASGARPRTAFRVALRAPRSAQ